MGRGDAAGAARIVRTAAAARRLERLSQVPMANVVDVQAAAKGKVAHTNPKHGPSLVAAVRTLAPGVPDAANLVKNKKIQQSFGFMFRSRKKDFLHELSHARKLYAAADAWATLEVARSLHARPGGN